jgi:D-alanyl-D-alanine carboxypeptidase
MRFFPEGEGAGEVTPRSEEPVPAGRPEVQLPREALERIAGEYVHAGVVLRVFLDADVPKAQLTGQPAFEIFAESPSTFFYKVVEATLEFAPANAPARSVTLRQGGAVIEYVRRDD